MIVIRLPMPISSNNMFVNGQRGRFRSQKYDSWIQEAGTEIMRQRPPKCLGPCNLTFEFQEAKDRRKFDITNRIKPTEDLLVKHGIIEADDWSIVRKVTACFNAEVEGVRVTIEPLFNRGQ
jgi:Holliday junction resolvase RusA-like endonuclease